MATISSNAFSDSEYKHLRSIENQFVECIEDHSTSYIERDGELITHKVEKGESYKLEFTGEERCEFVIINGMLFYSYRNIESYFNLPTIGEIRQKKIKSLLGKDNIE